MTANERQVGGNHYASEYQHWDFVYDIQLDYHRACALKYITRARKKNGQQDLEKAIHFAEKAKELGLTTSIGASGAKCRLAYLFVQKNVPGDLQRAAMLLLQGYLGPCIKALQAAALPPT